MPLKSKNTVSITFTFDRTCRAFFGLGEPECLHWDDWDVVSTSFHTLRYTLIHFFSKIWYKFFEPFLLTNENRWAHKNMSNLSGCHRQSTQWIQLKILSYFRGMYTNIITKNFDNRTLQTREIKKFPLFSEHTSYYCYRKHREMVANNWDIISSKSSYKFFFVWTILFFIFTWISYY